MADSTLGAGNEKSIWFMPWVINKITRRIGNSAMVTLIQASTSVDNLISRVYSALRVASTTNEMFGSEWRVLARVFEQGMNIGRRLGLFGATAVAQDAYIAALTTANTASAVTDLRYTFSSKITHPSYDATLEADPSIQINFAYPTTA